jgi:hypothetical protein
MGVFSHFSYGVLMLMDGVRTNSLVEAKGSVGACRSDSASTCGLRGELLECRVCVAHAHTSIFSHRIEQPY